MEAPHCTAAVQTGVHTAGLKVAVTDVAAPMVTVQAPSPEQPPPDQPAKLDPELVTAVSVTTVPPVNVDEQDDAVQSIPEGLEVTVPVPEPAFVTVRA